MNSTSPDKVSIAIGNSIAEMTKVVDLVDRFGDAHRIPRTTSNDLNLCLDELLNNTISYGYDDNGLHIIVITLSLAEGRLIAEIRDDGKPFDPREAAAVLKGDLQSRTVGGLGLHFVKTLMDEVGYMRVGQQNVVTIAKGLFQGAADGDC
jgi:anti-sigma regulatory factor (Ser/Thr protein kinase)